VKPRGSVPTWIHYYILSSALSEEGRTNWKVQESPRGSAIKERNVLDRAILVQSHWEQAGVEEQV